MAAFRQRGAGSAKNSFNAPEAWHEPGSEETGNGVLAPARYIVHPPGEGYIHPVTTDEVADRLAALPSSLTEDVAVVQFSRMTRKRSFFPCYGMQWGNAVYLYPIEESLVEVYRAPPSPQQMIEARMYGGKWEQSGAQWKLVWTPSTIRDFYLNNVLIHEVGHVNDRRNTSVIDRERYANWFAIEYGFRQSRKRK